MKVAHGNSAREMVSRKRKVISVYRGQFLEYLLRAGVSFGLNTVNRTYTVAGQPNNKFSITSTAGVGSALTRVSIAGLAKIVGNKCGETIEVKTTDAAETKQKFIDNPAHLLSLIKYVFGSGSMDFSTKNDNELVNPGESFWKVKTVSDAVNEEKEFFVPMFYDGVRL